MIPLATKPLIRAAWPVIATLIATLAIRLEDRAAFAEPTAPLPAELQFVPGREGEVRHTALDTRRAANRIGWRATTELGTGLQKTFKSFRQRLAPSAAAATDAQA